jgi:acyl carrier protein
VGLTGEICIGGIGLSTGYLNNPGLTIEKFLKLRGASEGATLSNLYRTGDLGRWLAGGSIQFLGRIDHQVKIRGLRIELGEIEDQLLKHPAIKEAVVTVIENETGGNYLCAYIVAVSPGSLDDLLKENLNMYLSRYLPDYMIPAYFLEIEALPLTPSGKIDRKALPLPGVGQFPAAYVPPGTPTGETLAAIWGELLGIDKNHISIDTNFFEMGGHSLTAVIMLSRVHKELNVRIPLAEMFKAPTIRSLAKYIYKSEEERYASIEPVEKKDYYILSSAQKRLYILQQMELASTAYNMPQIIPLAEEPGINQLEQTFIQLIHRHESLRTSFHMVQDVPVQKVHEKVEFEIEYKEVEVEVKVEEGGQSTESAFHAPCSMLHANSIKAFVRPFDLSRAPLVRGLVAQHQDGRYLLMVDMHHIISDGVSHTILEQDFISLFEGEELPPLRLHYKDYSRWQTSQKETENLKHQETYWLKTFEEEIPVLNLPLDYPRPNLRSFEGGIVSFEIGAPETKALKAITHEQSTTLFMVLLALYNIFLAKITLQEDIIIGTPIAGRRHTDLEKIIGMFVNTLLLRNYPKGEKTFTAFLKELREKTLEAFENQDYQFEDLVEKLSITKHPGRNPLFDVMFSFHHLESQPGRESQEKTPGKETGYLQYENTTSKFDLSLDVTAGEKLHFSFEYSSKLFKKTTIERYVDHFKEILSSVLEDKNIKLEEIQLIRHHLLRRKPKKPAAEFGF